MTRKGEKRLDPSGATDAPVQRPAASVHTYDAPVPEFALTRVVAGADGDGGVAADVGPSSVSATLEGPAIVVVTDGSVQVRSGSDEVVALAAGEVAWSSAGPPPSIDGPGDVFIATVPG